jgi:hypothetical protein
MCNGSGNVVQNHSWASRAAVNLLKPSGYFMLPVLTLKNSTWCPHCVYVFCTGLRTNSSVCLIKHSETGFYNRSGECLQRGMH